MQCIIMQIKGIMKWNEYICTWSVWLASSFDLLKSLGMSVWRKYDCCYLKTLSKAIRFLFLNVYLLILLVLIKLKNIWRPPLLKHDNNFRTLNNSFADYLQPLLLDQRCVPLHRASTNMCEENKKKNEKKWKNFEKIRTLYWICQF